MDLVTKAAVFAMIAHDGQKRKHTGRPYVSHCQNVAEIVSSVVDNERMVAAAWLHDTVEDTPTTHEEIGEFFGPAVQQFVFALTDISQPQDGNRAKRKGLDRIHLAQNTSWEVCTIKLADLIDNTRDIVFFDPDFAKVYMEEKRKLLFVLKDGHEGLYKIASDMVRDYYES